MRNIYKSCLQVLMVILTLAIGSCRKFVSVPAPATVVVTSSIFTNDATATSAQTAIYTKMQNLVDLASLSQVCGLLADELTNCSSSSRQVEYYSNSMQSKTVPQPWEDAYNYIYRANAVISGLQNYSGVSSAAKQQLTGEAEFTRAFWNFYLTNCYGSIPLLTSTDYATNATAVRSSASQAYRQIITDLADAESLLNPNYVDATDSVITTERVRPTKWAAAALLARTYLYNGIYDSAEQQSTLVISNQSNLYELCQNLDSVFLENNTEAIWQIPPVQPASNLATPEGIMFVLKTSPYVSGVNNSTTISPQLMNSFETGDLRKSQWINVYKSSGGTSYYYPYKYKVFQSTSLVEYTVVLRLAEQYLIRAEARAQQGNTSGAVADLNVIRNRAGLPSYSGPTDQPNLLNAILHERQVELFTELGHRWFDLNRTATINSVMSLVTPSKSGSWSTDWELFPIPFFDLNADPKLVQNPGY